MNVVVNRSALEKAIKQLLEKRSIQSTRIDTVAGKEIESESDSGESPIQASEMMSAQLADAAPPVADPDFVPVNVEQLGLSARLIAQEVPDSQIEFFYRKLHKLLDISLDRSGPNSQEISESLREKIFTILEQDEKDLDSEEELPDISDEDAERLLRDRDPVVELVDAAKDLELNIVQKWLDAGMLSDARRNIEEEHPEIFDRSVNQATKVISLLMTPNLSSMVSSAARQMGKREETVKILVIRKFAERYPKESISTGVGSLTPEQVKVNQELDKELKELLVSKTYDEIIELYDERISSATDPLEKRGYQMLQTVVRNRKVDSRKRRRQDHSVRIGQYNLDVDDPESDTESDKPVVQEPQSTETEEERLKALDDMAPVFGFKNASGIRQWRRKFADPKFKALLGSTSGIDAYEGFHERVNDNLAALLDVFNDIAQNALENLETAVKEKPNDTELSQIKDSFKHIADELSGMHSASLDSEDGLPSATSLRTTAAGAMLKSAFRDLFYDGMLFRPFANLMKKHMVKFLKSKGLEDKSASTFSKMFNGEVDLVQLDSEKKMAAKLRAGGVTADIYEAAVKESEKFTKDFFTVQQKEMDKKFAKLLQDKKKMVDAFEKSIDEGIKALEFEEEYDIQTSDPERAERIKSLRASDEEMTDTERMIVQRIASFVEEEEQ